MRVSSFDDQPRAERARPLDNGALNTFYRVLWLPYAADFVLHELLMLGGKCKMEQRELVLQMCSFPYRHCVFRSEKDVLDTLEQMLKRGEPPVNMHVGPVWNARHLGLSGIWPPYKDAVSPEFAPNVDLLKPREFERTERGTTGAGEFVIDCDIPEERRVLANCCRCAREKKVCERCWTRFMLPAQRILTHLLRTYFGFKRFFTVFSGRRGFHIWLMDEAVLRWTLWERRAFCEALMAPLKPDADLYSPLCEFVWRAVLEQLAVGRTREATFADLYPELDAKVSQEEGHLHKLPLMLNANTGLFCDILADPEDEVHRFVASQKQLFDLTLSQLNPEVVQGCVAHLRRVLRQ